MGAVKSSLVLNDGMSPALRRINNAMSLVLNNFEAVQRASGKSMNTANIAVARQEIGRANAALDQMEQNYRDCNSQQEELNQHITAGTSKAKGLWGKIKGIAGAYMGMKTVTGLTGLSDTLASNAARLELIVDDGGSVAELQQKIYNSAQRARASYTDVMATVAKLGIVADKAFGSNDELIKYQELVNKNFGVGRASAAEQASATYQLTQAMASGRLQGDEYRSIIENAPLLNKYIEDYMRNVQGLKGTMKEWSSDGLITSDVIKAAVFNSANEVEERFKKIPMTWQDVWTSMKNRAVIALGPVLTKINELANNPSVQNGVNGLINGFVFVAGALLNILGLVSTIYNFIANNWGWISPIIYGIAAALGVYFIAVNSVKIAEMASAVWTGITTAAKIIATAATWLFTSATLAQAGAQWGLNAALYACPLVWIIILIIAIIAIIYAVIGAINKLTGSSISATGIILGSLAAAGAFIWDLVLGCLEHVLGVINYLINPFIEIANFIGNVFTNPVSSIIYLFQGMADNVLGILQKIASALDFVFGSNMADAVQGWRDGLKGKADALVAEYAPNENYQDVMNNLNLSVDGLGLKRIAYSDAWNAGYNAGEGIDTAVGNMFNFDDLTKGTNIPGADQFTNMGNNLDDIAGDTSSLANSSDKTTEELAYLRDIAEQEAINRFTTAEVKIDMTGMTNRIDSSMDLDGVLNILTDSFAEALEVTAEGVHV